MGDWACPCSGCQKAVKWERKQIVELVLGHRNEYLIDRGSSFDIDNNLMWAKDDALAYCEALDYVVELINNRNPKPKEKK